MAPKWGGNGKKWGELDPKWGKWSQNWGKMTQNWEEWSQNWGKRTQNWEEWTQNVVACVSRGVGGFNYPHAPLITPTRR